MGHVRLGTLPKTREWKEVVRLIAEGADVETIASAAFKAADKVFEKLGNDAGFTEVAWLMSQLGVASAQKDPQKHFESLGLALPPQASILDVVLAVKQTVERNVRAMTDEGALAVNALTSALTRHLESETGLFHDSSAEIHRALSDLGKPSRFGNLTHTFFSELISKGMGAFLDRDLANHVGAGQRFRTMAEMRSFSEAMHKHCSESAEIVRDYGKGWFSKARYDGEGNIRRDKAGGFGWYGVQKIRAELRMRSNDSDK